MFVSWESVKNGRIASIASMDGEDGVELRGSPDWVLEVVSPSSVEKDTRQLVEAYFRAGVREYWIVNAFGPEIDFRILARQPDGFAATPSHEGWHYSDVFEREFRLQRERNRIGRWRYTLDQRPASR